MFSLTSCLDCVECGNFADVIYKGNTLCKECLKKLKRL